MIQKEMLIWGNSSLPNSNLTRRSESRLRILPEGEYWLVKS